MLEEYRKHLNSSIQKQKLGVLVKLKTSWQSNVYKIYVLVGPRIPTEIWTHCATYIDPKRDTILLITSNDDREQKQ